ncbi:ubiquinol oxidase subunit II [Sphingomonas ginkgonis]|uniref:ubiquinol oxidase subunit II n=1 Tax=Sphingomonas ginkgonis TaxID=2315330 RepID=UPI001EF04AE7|nr:ubiquinol oxidase subunit II [Sphingomonas ginkgonis]
MIDRFSRLRARPARFLALVALPLLAGCSSDVLNPAGYIAQQQRDIILISTALMLLIIVPVLVLTVAFAWRYRASNKDATYDPHFDHSTALELVIWSAPLLIIIALGALTWWSTHLLDPFRPIEQASATEKVAPNAKTLRIEVVSLDWKWLFIYPDQGIATVNELALPVGVPVRFDMTSTNMMNTFDVPTLAGMIYTMPGMRSQLHAILNRPVETIGFSGNYSGAGFSDMVFKVHGVPAADFQRWVGRVKASPLPLSDSNFAKLVRPSEKVKPIYFSSVAPDLFRRVYERCVEPGKPCMSDMMRHDQAGGGGNPRDMRSGGGMPAGRDTDAIFGTKPKGALQKSPEEKGSSPHLTTPRGSEPPGATNPGSNSNRNMTFNDPRYSPASAGEPVNV